LFVCHVAALDQPGWREQILIFFAGAATATVLGGLLVRRRRYDSD
jgi:MYXO-CTERM domain-containing protein